MRRVAVVLALVAAVLAATDLLHKAAVETPFQNPRPPEVMAVLGAVGIAWGAAVVAVGSTALAAAGGVLLGGVAGNVLSVAFWPAIPDPLVAGTLAYNLADVFVTAGTLATVAVAAWIAVRDRTRLGDRVMLR